MDNKEKADKKKQKKQEADKIMKEWKEVIAEMEDIAFNKISMAQQDYSKEGGILLLELDSQHRELYARTEKLKKQFDKANK